MTGSLMLHFSRLPDPRGDRGRRHKLVDVMTIAVLAVLCWAQHWTEMEEFGRAKKKWPRTFLELPNGIPSHDTFDEVFAALNLAASEALFRARTLAVAGEIVGVLAIDGKTIRRSFDTATGKTAVKKARPGRGRTRTTVPAPVGLHVGLLAHSCRPWVSKRGIRASSTFSATTKNGFHRGHGLP